MNRLLYFALFSMLLLAFSACDNNDTHPGLTIHEDGISLIDWKGLKEAVIKKDNSKVGAKISRLLTNSEPDPTASDELGQKANIEKLVLEINKSGVLMAELLCYACIETLPPQTEIKLTTLGGAPVTRIIDISTPADGILEYLNIHD